MTSHSFRFWGDRWPKHVLNRLHGIHA